MTDLIVAHAHSAGLGQVSVFPQGFSELEHSVLASCTWGALAPVMAAEPTMRLWNRGARFNESADLTKVLPDKPAAVPLYRRGRTRLIALDLDAKVFGVAAVEADCARIVGWVAGAGGQVVVDCSSSGGVHVLVPLEYAVTRAEIRPLLEAMAARCPTLDLAPMLNESWTGCISVPGSRCREGGFRVLRGSLGAATDVFVRGRSGPGVLARLAADLGVAQHSVGEGGAVVGCVEGVFVGVGERLRLQPGFCVGSELPSVVAVFAETGQLAADGRWGSASEARQSVLVHALWRGMSLVQVRALMAAGQRWAGGLGACYRRYGHERAVARAISADWDKAAGWHQRRVASFHGEAHKNRHTGVVVSSGVHERWLAHALLWCDTTFRASSRRWAVAAVLQSLAVMGARAGVVVGGVPTVAVGGRALSLAAGLLSKETVWDVLRELREMAGSPILLVEEHGGLLPDGYALVEPDCGVRECGAGAGGLVEVHAAWWIVGLGHRRVYEVVAAGGVGRVADIAVAARMSLSATYESVGELCRVGLLARSGRLVVVGQVSLDRVADLFRLHEVRAERIAEYRQDRQLWRGWLGGRRAVPAVELEPVVQSDIAGGCSDAGFVDVLLSAADEAVYWELVMAAGPLAVCEQEVAGRVRRRDRQGWRWNWGDPEQW